MSESIPKCRNAVKSGDHKSDMRLKGETGEAWVFQCKICELVHVISKDGVRNKSNFELAAQRRREEEERVRRWAARKKIFC